MHHATGYSSEPVDARRFAGFAGDVLIHHVCTSAVSALYCAREMSCSSRHPVHVHACFLPWGRLPPEKEQRALMITLHNPKKCQEPSGTSVCKAAANQRLPSENMPAVQGPS